MTDLPPPTPAGKLLRRAREMAVPKLSRPEVAHSAGIDPGTLGNIERGYRHLGEGRVREVPGEADVIAKVARVLKIPPDRLADEGQRPDAAEILREILRTPPEPPAAERHLEAVPAPLALPDDPADDEVEDFILDQESPYLRRILMRTWRTESIPREVRVASVRAVAAAEAQAAAGHPGAQRERRREPGA